MQSGLAQEDISSKSLVSHVSCGVQDVAHPAIGFPSILRSPLPSATWPDLEGFSPGCSSLELGFNRTLGDVQMRHWG